MNIFVGNISFQTTEQQLQTIFAPFGEVKSVKIVTDRFSNRSRGFAFVEMDENGEKAIEGLNNTMLNFQSIVVNEAKVKRAEKTIAIKK